MKIIKNNVPQVQPESKIFLCVWCKSELEVEKEDTKRGTVHYSQREVDYGVAGFDCPCCKSFSPLTLKK